MNTKALRRQLPSKGLQFQDSILPGVSRTFALTIPQLPPGLQDVVANGYLLCRISDTIEDDPELDFEAKKYFTDWFQEALAGRASADDFAQALTPRLAETTSEDERTLIERTGDVLAITHALEPDQREALERCVNVMSEGMLHYQSRASLHGLDKLSELDDYCYFVAGVVGEMLTELFCGHSRETAQARAQMLWLSASFGQGLQMTNILKDIWADRARGMCWLPRDVFAHYGFDLDDLQPGHYDEAFGEGLHYLIGLARAHLANAVLYTRQIPVREVGIRRFCLWAIGLAVMTLRRIEANPDFTTTEQVKVPRGTLRSTMMTTSVAAYSNRMVEQWFRWAARDLPYVPLPGSWSPGRGYRLGIGG